MGRMKKKKTDGLSEIPKVPVKNISLNQLVGSEQRVGGVASPWIQMIPPQFLPPSPLPASAASTLPASPNGQATDSTSCFPFHPILNYVSWNGVQKMSLK